MKNLEDITIHVTPKVTRDTPLDLEHLVQRRPQTNLHIRSDDFAQSSFHEDFRAKPKAQLQMKVFSLWMSWYDSVLPILELLSNEDQTLLVSRSAFFLLHLRLHVVDSVGLLKTGKT